MQSKSKSALAQAAFNAIVKSQRLRTSGGPVRDEFFKCTRDGRVHYPLAELMNSRSGKSGGGRGGKTRVLLYLSLLWVAAGAGHASNRPARFWAELLRMDDPDNAGSRAIRSTWTELAARGFVTITSAVEGGAPPIIQLLREDGSGRPYSIPQGEDGDTYRRIPRVAYRTLFPSDDLTGAALAMYLVAFRTAGRAQRTTGLVFSRAHVSDAYGLGESTRRSGLKTLVEIATLDASSARTDEYGDGSRASRKRTTYTLAPQYAPESANPYYQELEQWRAAEAERQATAKNPFTATEEQWAQVSTETPWT